MYFGGVSAGSPIGVTVKNAEVVRLLIENERPVIITYQIIEGHGDAKIIVAPRQLDA